MPRYMDMLETVLCSNDALAQKTMEPQMGLWFWLRKKGKASTDDSTTESKPNPYQPSMANPKAVPTKPVAVAANNDQPLTTPQGNAEDEAARWRRVPIVPGSR